MYALREQDPAPDARIPPVPAAELTVPPAAEGPKLPWREAGPPNHHDDKVDSDQ